MTDVVLPSPCVSICQIDAAKSYCTGCYRTRREIAAWSRMDASSQRALIAELQERRAEATGRPRRSRRRVKTNK